MKHTFPINHHLHLFKGFAYIHLFEGYAFASVMFFIGYAYKKSKHLFERYAFASVMFFIGYAYKKLNNTSTTSKAYLFEGCAFASPMFFIGYAYKKLNLKYMNQNTTFREGYVIRDQNAPHFLTFTVCGWIDLFTRKAYRDILLDSFTYCRANKGLILNAYVIMSNHIHLIARAREGKILSDIIRDFKAHTHRQMIKIINSEKESRRHWMLHQLAYYASRHKRNENYQIWIQDSHPEELISYDMTITKLNYIHQNPVRAGYVSEPQYYLYSSAENYINKSGLIEIDLML